MRPEPGDRSIQVHADDIVAACREVGITTGDVVMFHSSLSSMGGTYRSSASRQSRMSQADPGMDLVVGISASFSVQFHCFFKVFLDTKTH